MTAYLISRVVVRDPAPLPAYIKGSVALATSYGARYLARAEQVEAADGSFTGDRLVLIEFPSMTALRAFWDSDEYQELRKLRLAGADGDVWLFAGEDETPPKA